MYFNYFLINSKIIHSLTQLFSILIYEFFFTESTSKDNNKPLITHRRFLGNDDYRAYIWVQYTGKDREADSDDEEIQKLNKEPQEILTCPSCSFKAKRLGVMLMHSKMHLDGKYLASFSFM